MRLLALFDVDGTLLLSHDPLAGEALAPTLEAFYPVRLPADSMGGIDHAGQTSLRVARLVLRHAGLDDGEIDEHLTGWCAAFASRYVELLADADTAFWQVAPGAAEALSDLEAGGVRSVLLTGNPEPVARSRMERIGLAAFFPAGQGAFGCEAESRTELVAIARERAGGWPAEQTVEIGDTLRDVDTAHEAAIRSILVPSSRTAEEHAARADAVWRDLGGAAAQLLAWSG
jgi:phosphoglycolate phosphatase-like HAD superfamily hydrolase